MLRIATLALLTALTPTPLHQEDGTTTVSTNCPSKEPHFVSHQLPDGSWSASKLLVRGAGIHPGEASDDVVVTALRLLSFMGDGMTSERGPYQAQVTLALDYLVEQQADDGHLWMEGSKTALADQAIAALALSEATYLSESGRYREAARAAIAYLEERALPGGGWSATGSGEGPVDFRSTAWASMALTSARDAKLCERPELISAAAWRLRAEGGAIAQAGTRELSFELMTRIFAGEVAARSPELQARAAELLARPFEWQASGEGVDPESYYFSTLIAYRSGGQLWKDWSAGKLWRKHLAHLRDEQRMVADASLPGGAVAAHAYMTLTLEVYLRYALVVGAR